ncbi:MAG: hypothetical protein Q9183_006481 [Haloplaca sp. 2 TL-2023]
MNKPTANTSHRAAPTRKGQGKRPASSSSPAGEVETKKQKTETKAASDSPPGPKLRSRRQKPGVFKAPESSSDELEDEDDDDEMEDYDDYPEDNEDDLEDEDEDEDAEMDDAPDSPEPTRTHDNAPVYDFTQSDFPHIIGPSNIKDWLTTEMLSHVEKAPIPQPSQQKSKDDEDF